jgi:hypothetical protein
MRNGQAAAVAVEEVRVEGILNEGGRVWDLADRTEGEAPPGGGPDLALRTGVVTLQHWLDLNA